MPSEPQKRECRCPRARHRHGTRAAYRRDGCRCHECRLAYDNAALSYYHGGSWREQELLPMVGVQRRLQALSAIGWTWTALGQRLDRCGEAVRSMAVGVQRTANRPDTAERIAELYDELWNVQPTGKWCDRARRVAVERGWLPPMAWDDDTIDDPDAQPYTDGDDAPLDEIAIERAMHGDPVSLTPAERTEAVARLTARGYSAHEISQRLHITARTVQRKRAA